MAGSPEVPELDLRGYAAVLRRRARLIALVTLLFLGGALALALTTTPRYRATAEILLAPRRSETLFDAGAPQLAQDSRRYVATEIRVITSQPVRAAAAARLGYRARVSARGSPDDNVVTVTTTGTDPRRAARTVNTYVETYIEHRRTANVEDSLKAQAVIQPVLDEKRRQLAALDDAFDRGAASEADALAAAQRDERASLVSQLGLLASQIDRLQIGAGLTSGEAQLLTPAAVPSSPYEPDVPRAVALALVLGVGLGVGLAFLAEYLDDTVRTKDDLERATGGMPVLGVIPVTPGGRAAKVAQTVTLRAPASVAAEAYRGLRTSVQFLGLDAPVRSLQVTSPSSAEGKTTTVANLAAALASAGQRVIVVDCDLRRSRVHQFFQLPNEAGFTSVVLGEVPLSEALMAVPGVDGLQVLAAGPRPPNPSELLAGPRAVEVLLALQSYADVVVIDSPPVLPVADGLALAARVNATVVVARSRRTSGRSLARALELLRQVDAPVVGTVLNGAAADDGYGYRYSYGYGPGATLGAAEPAVIPAAPPGRR